MRIKNVHYYYYYYYYKLIQYQILQTNIPRTVLQTVRRITNEILGVKGLKTFSEATFPKQKRKKSWGHWSNCEFIFYTPRHICWDAYCLPALPRDKGPSHFREIKFPQKSVGNTSIWATAHLPLPQPNINPNLLSTDCWKYWSSKKKF